MTPVTFMEFPSDYENLQIEVKRTEKEEELLPKETKTSLSTPKYVINITSQLGTNSIAETSFNITPREVERALASTSRYPTRAESDQSEVTFERSLSHFDPIVEMGSRLFSNIFTGRQESVYRRSLELAKKRGKGLRLRLLLDDAELMALPWEFLYDPKRQDFVNIHPQSLVVRTHREQEMAPPAPPSPRLRVLIVTVEVQGTDLNLKEDIEILQSLKKLYPELQLYILRDPSPAKLTEFLANQSFDIFHFAGRSMYNTMSDEQQLYLASDQTNLSMNAKLVEALSTKKELRLILLNACNTEKIASLLAKKTSAPTIGIRGDITEQACLAFARAMYQSILRGEPLEIAVTRGRQNVDADNPGSREWALPVFYLPTSSSVFLVQPEEPVEKSIIPEATEALADDPAHQREWHKFSILLSMQNRNLRILEKKKASYKDNVPKSINNQILEAQQRIRKLEEMRNRLTSDS